MSITESIYESIEKDKKRADEQTRFELSEKEIDMIATAVIKKLHVKNEPDANEPDANEPDANEPDANEPDANEPDVEEEGVE